MKNELNIKTALRVFDRLSREGEQTAQGYRLGDLRGWTDFDGYTLYLSDGQVTLSLFFHNSYQFDYDNQAALYRFIRLLDAIDAGQT